MRRARHAYARLAPSPVIFIAVFVEPPCASNGARRRMREVRPCCGRRGKVGRGRGRCLTHTASCMHPPHACEACADAAAPAVPCSATCAAAHRTRPSQSRYTKRSRHSERSRHSPRMQNPRCDAPAGLAGAPLVCCAVPCWSRRVPGWIHAGMCIARFAEYMWTAHDARRCSCHV